jgi:dolichol-phosphate mannosyltransferase
VAEQLNGPDNLSVEGIHSLLTRHIGAAPKGDAVQLDLSIVVPMYNEADNVAPLVRETVAAMSGRAFELVLVDDGSSDATLAEALRLSEGLPQLRVLQHPCRRGQSAAVCSGVLAAHAAWVATLDGDLQNDPRDLGVLLAARDAAHDERVRLVIGHRLRRQDGLWRHVQSRLANGVRARLLGDRVPDSACGIKLFARDTYLSLPRFDHMHRFLPALFLRTGGRVITVAVRHRPRTAGRSKYGMLERLSAGVADLAGVIWLSLRHVPLGDAVELAAGRSPHTPEVPPADPLPRPTPHLASLLPRE